MATENDYEKLKEVMEFPAAMTFKVAGVNRERLSARHRCGDTKIFTG